MAVRATSSRTSYDSFGRIAAMTYLPSGRASPLGSSTLVTPPTPGGLAAGLAGPPAMAKVIDSQAPIRARHLAKRPAALELFVDLQLRVQRDVPRETSKAFPHPPGLITDPTAVAGAPPSGPRQM